MQSKKPPVEDFIKSAKASKAEISEPEQAAIVRGDVTFPLHIQKEVHVRWKKFAHRAEKSLHDFICVAVQEKIKNMENEK
jgi:predicted HicB family RNase H-like nuclease